jgi:hypothetical protein
VSCFRQTATAQALAIP